MARIGHVLTLCVLCGFAIERRTCVELPHPLCEFLEIFEILKDVVFESIFAKDANAVEIAFGEIFEAPLSSDREENSVTIEGSLSLPSLFESVRGRGQQMHRVNDFASTRFGVSQPCAGAPQIEAHETLGVGIVLKSTIIGQSLP